MSDFSNPYNSPQSPIVPEKIQNGAMTDTMLRYLKEASPWLRFIGIVGFIGFGFICLSGLINIINSFGSSGKVLFDALDEALNINFFGALGFLGTLTITIFYTLWALLVFFPARFTYLFGVKIRNYLFSNSDEDIESALKNNKSLFKFNGILLIIQLSIIPLLIIGMIVIGLVAASNVF